MYRIQAPEHRAWHPPSRRARRVLWGHPIPPRSSLRLVR
jgi:hypothetical protein